MNSQQRFRRWILCGDLVYAAAALYAAVHLHEWRSVDPIGVESTINEWWLVLAVALPAWVLLYSVMRLDGFSGEWHLPSMLSQIALSIGALTCTLTAFAFIAHRGYSRIVFFYYGVFLFIGFAVIRYGVWSFLQSNHQQRGKRRVVILGGGQVSRELARKMQRHPEFMCDIVGFLFPSHGDEPLNSLTPPGKRVERPTVPTVGVVDLLRRHSVDMLVVALPDGSATELKKLVAMCHTAGIQISLVPQWYELYVSEVRLLDFDGLPMLSLVEKRPSAIDCAVKRVMDLVLGSLFLVVAAPALLIAGLTLLFRKARVFESEMRCGQNGVLFPMYRFAIDRNHYDERSPFERFLARFSITELPQLWNVLRGDMSLVGPRPETPQRTRDYSDWQRQRLSVMPGLTGLAQVRGLRDEHSSEEKARFDLQYIFHWSPFMDLSLILETCWTVLFRARVQSKPPRNGRDAALPMGDLSLAEVEYVDRTHSCAD